MGDGAAMSSAEFTRLASLPPKPIILAMLLGQLQSPIARLVTVMNGPMQSLGNVLAARVRQIEEEGPVTSSTVGLQEINAASEVTEGMSGETVESDPSDELPNSESEEVSEEPVEQSEDFTEVENEGEPITRSEAESTEDE